MLQHMLANVVAWSGAPVVTILWREGPRNAPALIWLNEAGTRLDDRRFVVRGLDTEAPASLKVDWSEGSARE
jgi:hypothetical protein